MFFFKEISVPLPCVLIVLNQFYVNSLNIVFKTQHFDTELKVTGALERRKFYDSVFCKTGTKKCCNGVANVDLLEKLLKKE